MDARVQVYGEKMQKAYEFLTADLLLSVQDVQILTYWTN